MSTMKLKSAVTSRAAVRAAAPKARIAAARPVLARAQPEDKPVTFNFVEESTASTSAPSTSASTAVAVETSDFKLLNQTTEALNGRSAMLGFVAAVIAEASTHQTVWSQIAGKYADMELIEKPIGAASLGFGAVVAIVTMATLMPKLIDGADVNSKSFGPFTPALESTVGRVAMMGFLGLVVVELVKGSSLL